MSRSLPPVARLLGFAGLLPQILAVPSTFGEQTRFVGLAAGFFYAALIFSFLGGLWWGIAATRENAPVWLFAVAVMPSLIAFASGIPWMIGTSWPGPSLMLLGGCILLAALVDRWLYQRRLIDVSLWKLRLALSLGLGGLTVLLSQL